MRCAWSVSAAVTAAVFALAVTGCSGEGKVGTVSGTVTVDGKPTEGVALTFASADGRVVTAASDAQGHYQAAGVPVGPVTVTAYGLGGEEGGQSEGMVAKNRGQADPSRPPSPPASAKKQGPKVADRFGDPNTSGLKHTATEGESKFDVPLASK